MGEATVRRGDAITATGAGTTAGLYLRLLGARIRSEWQYRFSFITLLLGQALVTALEFVTLILVVALVPSLGGWTGPEVAFLYGLAATAFGISDLFYSSLDEVAEHVREGTFDQYLLRPMSPMLQLLVDEFELRRIGKTLPPVAVLVWAVAAVDVTWTAGRIALLSTALIFGTVIYCGLWIMAAAITFWIVASREAMNAFTFGGQFANEYPHHLYARWIRAVLGWAIPIAYVAYVPTIAILETPNPLGLPPWLVHTTGPVAAVTVLAGWTTWRLGIRHYQSTGS